VLDLEHYLDVLIRKPGALAGSRPLAQWRTAGRWTAAYDELWQSLQQRHGKATGTRLMIEILQLGRKSGSARLTRTIEQALELGTHDAAAVCYLLRAPELEALAAETAPPLHRTMLTGAPGNYTGNYTALMPQHFERPLPCMDNYDLLLTTTASQRQTHSEIGTHSQMAHNEIRNESLAVAAGVDVQEVSL